MRTAREYIPAAIVDDEEARRRGGIAPGPDTAPGLDELAARAAQDAAPRLCGFCSGLDSHNRACPAR
jgi:hypothetical protein